MIQRIYHNNNETAYFYHRRFKSLLLASQAVPLTDDYWAKYFFYSNKKDAKKTLNKKSMVGYVGLDQVCRHCGALSTVKNFFRKFIKY